MLEKSLTRPESTSSKETRAIITGGRGLGGPGGAGKFKIKILLGKLGIADWTADPYDKGAWQ